MSELARKLMDRFAILAHSKMLSLVQFKSLAGGEMIEFFAKRIESSIEWCIASGNCVCRHSTSDRCSVRWLI